MKFRIARITLFFLLPFLVSQCGQKGDGNVHEHVTKEDAAKHEHESDITQTDAGAPQFTVTDVFQNQLSNVFASYVSLKDAFVESNPEKVKKEANKTVESLGKVDKTLVEGPAHDDWMTYYKDLSSALAKISSASDLEIQRTHFSELSNALYKAIKAYGLGGATAYYEFCPMAFDDKGAYWLSDNSKIRNPYFGDKMLTCGSVEETLR